MKRLTKIADRMLSAVAPKAEAAACSGCYIEGRYAGPCAGGYGNLRCCYYWGPAGTCYRVCNLVCP